MTAGPRTPLPESSRLESWLCRSGPLRGHGARGRPGRVQDAVTLRDLALTAPYMHDGSLATIEAVIDFYNQGGRPNPHLDREIRPLKLTDDEKRTLAAFLRALAGQPDPRQP